MNAAIIHSIVLIDDHPLAINGIGAWLNSTGRFSIVGTAGTLTEAETLLEKIDSLPDIIILDISLGTEDGLKFIPILKEIATKRNQLCPKVLVCSMYEDTFLIQRSIDSGADAYVSKSEELDEIIKAIDAIMIEKTYFNQRYHITTDKNPWEKLTSRENEIAALVKQSFNNKQIADKLNISERTVGNHLVHIYEKMGITSRAELFDM
jgi:NarL family two-component system response regulator LiaR